MRSSRPLTEKPMSFSIIINVLRGRAPGVSCILLAMIVIVVLSRNSCTVRLSLVILSRIWNWFALTSYLPKNFFFTNQLPACLLTDERILTKRSPSLHSPSLCYEFVRVRTCGVLEREKSNRTILRFWESLRAWICGTIGITFHWLCKWSMKLQFCARS